ncbi:hypothetical protein BCR37DRAFT_377059 [Protomyces lactucae-debilis]|uniref:AMP-activated protein kinase glycogen-binding domain-containing protein n=1 Tax=Protomyces lactucae-debilis TaxID=2754530 RepID=A0A1Y2FQZ8_PROLT|nr:uncharacterized protein BCR37DRAFT_377059 [Protomyces lactucae-debilis]ORY86432.1 hypothetical protein BCR37DRAFT_377059 [Protomyces lactucae-debilis]
MVLHSFYWRYPASHVKLTGDFDNWEGSLDMLPTEEGHFVKVVDIEANTKVKFKYIVDGNWTVDHGAPKEGEGVHENNVLHTTTTASTESGTPVAAKTTSDFDTLPPVGGALAYASTSPLIPAADESSKTHDESGPSVSDPAAPRFARDGVAQSEPAALASSTASPENSAMKTSESQAGSTPGLVAASAPVKDSAVNSESLSATSVDAPTSDASNLTSSKKSSVIPVALGTSATAVGAAALGVAGVATARKTEGSSSSSAAAKGLESIGAQTTKSEGSSLEQTAVKAATAAANNAYTASGLGGVSSTAASNKDITGGQNVGFTSIGTAVNTATGVVGTSKLVQSSGDSKPVEDTKTAKLKDGAADHLLAEHKNGVKTERIDAHTVLAEVGLGGAAIGTAVVTDGTVKDASALPIPAAAAEHLDRATSKLADVAPPLAKDTATDMVKNAGATDQSKLSSGVAAPSGTTSTSTSAVPAAVVPVTPSADKAAVVAPVDTPRPVTADTQGSKTDASYKTASSASPQTLAAAPGKTMPSSLRADKAQAPETTEPKKKKGGLLRKMKSMFKNKD